MLLNVLFLAAGIFLGEIVAYNRLNSLLKTLDEYEKPEQDNKRIEVPKTFLNKINLNGEDRIIISTDEKPFEIIDYTDKYEEMLKDESEVVK